MRLHRSVRFYKQLSMYVFLFLMILLMLVTLIYNDVFKSYEREVWESNRRAVTQTATLLDSRFRNMEELVVYLSDSPQLKPYILKGGVYGELDAVKELKQFRTVNAFISEIALNYPGTNGDRIYTSNGVYDVDIFFEQTHVMEGMDAGILEEGPQGLAPRFTATRNLSHMINADTTRLLVGRYALPLRSLAPIGTVLLFVRYDTLDGLVREAFGQWEGCFAVVSGGGGPLYAYETPGNEAGVLDALCALPAEQSMAVDGVDYSVVLFDSALYDWSYRMAIPTQQYLAGVRLRRNSFLGAVGAAMLLGLALSVFFSRLNYRQLRRLANKLPHMAGKGDELVAISQSVERMLRENEGLAAQIRTRGALARRQYLLSLLLGLDAQESSVWTDIRWQGQHFGVLLLSIDDMEAFDKANDTRMRAVLRFSLCNVLEEASGGAGYAMDMPDQRTVALVCAFADAGSAEAGLAVVAEKVQQTLKTYYDFTCTVGIGGIYPDKALITRAYAEATQAVRHRASRGRGQVLWFARLEETASDFAYPVACERALSAALRARDESGARQAVAQAFSDLRSRAVPPAAVQGVVLWLLGVALQTLDQMGIQPGEAVYAASNAVMVSQDETSEKREEHLLALVRACCAHIGESRADQAVPKGDRLQQYVLGHYRSENLSLQEVADQFGVSPSYATTLLKERTGMPLMGYVDMLRLNEARALLREQDLPLREVVAAVGYRDVTAFIRKFKQAEGVTPAVYRREHRKRPMKA